ncbi:hypothetical protein KUA08_08325, partial [Komagataeibacter melomenusus]|uniref:hypothetical protein n=1 Tax=Komagataeibacter melomenusus TaxID=2766578 RepID=UPI0019D54577
RLLAKAQRFHFRPLGIRQYQAIHMQFKAHQGPCEKSIPNRPWKKLHQKLLLLKTLSLIRRRYQRAGTA